MNIVLGPGLKLRILFVFESEVEQFSQTKFERVALLVVVKDLSECAQNNVLAKLELV